MELLYNKPKDIILEIKTAIENNLTRTVGDQECKLREIILTKEEMSILVKDLTRDWDNKSNVQCHSIDENTDPYCGGYHYLEWNGRWSYEGGEISIVEQDS